MRVHWIADSWGIYKEGKFWFVCFGDPRQYVASGIYKKKRRAKKEVRYIVQGCVKGPFHGAYDYINGITI